MTLIEFLMAHGGNSQKLIEVSNNSLEGTNGEKFVPLKTVDGGCYLSFARKQFPHDSVDTPDKVRALLQAQGRNLDVLAGETRPDADGCVKACYTIVKHQDLYSGFTF